MNKLPWPLLRSLTGGIFNSHELSGFTWISDSGLILSPDLELDLRSLVHIRHLELGLLVWGLATLQPASSQLLLLLYHIPGKQKIRDFALLEMILNGHLHICESGLLSFTFYQKYF